jgi:hypothetical protein
MLILNTVVTSKQISMDRTVKKKMLEPATFSVKVTWSTMPVYHWYKAPMYFMFKL